MLSLNLISKVLIQSRRVGLFFVVFFFGGGGVGGISFFIGD